MKIMDKLKNLFTEEVEEETPIKKEVKHVEIVTPKREPVYVEEKPVEKVVEEVKPVRREPVVETPTQPNREEKFKFPVYFDDEDFEDLRKKEPPKKVEKVEPKKEKIEPYKGAKLVEEKKQFAPSPIISPVYGVLDKNYSKEDIQTRKEKPVRHYLANEKVTIDDVRKKAYGTLEDDLERNLFSEEIVDVDDRIPTLTEETYEEPVSRSTDLLMEDVIEEPIDEVDLTKELEKQKQKIDELNTFIKSNTVVKETKEEDIFEELEKTKRIKKVEPEEIEGTIEDDIIENIDEEPQEPKDLNDSDLFNLIDSMYEKRDDE